ncbi:YceI family protein [Caldimonas tepidiphila]|uniref:YceI family protein n=1 Tax=Caldimonas tepidiphila TaxID=2315841 RepID=UPI001475543C|nr:YceI family protein [Caldimonas tepidiphila]
MKKTLLIAALSAVAASAHAAPATYALDPTHTFVTFEIDHFGTSTNRGRFDRKEGSVQLDREAKTGRLEVTIDTGSINTGTAPFNKHLQSADFFNTAQHPSAKFVSDRLVFDGDRLSEVQGQLTLLGRTQPLTLKATRFNCYQNPMLKREVCGGDFEATLQRSQWGMDWGLKMGMPDAVRLVIQAEGVRQ